MSSCKCCLTSHPLRLIERLSSSIQTIKLIRTNCSIFKNILLDEYEHLQRISSNLNRYLIHYGSISNEISQFTNNRLENITKVLHELECLTRKCSIWLKKNSVKGIRSQLKHYGKQLDIFIRFVEQNSYKNNLQKTFWKDFSIFQTNYQQQCLQMDFIEREHMKLFIESIRLFSSIISPGNNEHRISTINIDQDINEWKEKNKFRLTWLPDEHQQKESTDLIEAENKPKLVEESSSDIEIKAIDNSSNDRQESYAYKSNLSWSFTIANKKEDLMVGYLFSFQMKKLLA
jgi:hypothetical protein